MIFAFKTTVLHNQFHKNKIEIQKYPDFTNITDKM